MHPSREKKKKKGFSYPYSSPEIQLAHRSTQSAGDLNQIPEERRGSGEEGHEPPGSPPALLAEGAIETPRREAPAAAEGLDLAEGLGVA